MVIRELYRRAACGTARLPPGQSAAPDIDNTIRALEDSGRMLDRVSAVFFNLAGAHTSDAIMQIEREMAPKLAAHHNAINLNEALFRRVEVSVFPAGSDHRLSRLIGFSTRQQ